MVLGDVDVEAVSPILGLVELLPDHYWVAALPVLLGGEGEVVIQELGKVHQHDAHRTATSHVKAVMNSNTVHKNN